MEYLSEEWIYQKSSQELTSLLYEALMDNLTGAIEDIKEKQYIGANKKLQNANDILYRLGAGINYEAGIISDQLDSLYNYMADRIIVGNIKKDISIIEEVLSNTERLAGAWNQAMKNKPDPKQLQLRSKVSAYEQNVMVLEKVSNTVEEGK